ncbi:hypothetical protein EMCRGX_G015203 [Ephydatia muelleri]
MKTLHFSTGHYHLQMVVQHHPLSRKDILFLQLSGISSSYLLSIFVCSIKELSHVVYVDETATSLDPSADEPGSSSSNRKVIKTGEIFLICVSLIELLKSELDEDFLQPYFAQNNGVMEAITTVVAV